MPAFCRMTCKTDLPEDRLRLKKQTLPTSKWSSERVRKISLRIPGGGAHFGIMKKFVSLLSIAYLSAGLSRCGFFEQVLWILDRYRDRH